MIKRILLAWLCANFGFAGIFALLSGGWYLRLPALPALAAEIGLIILPNLLLPFMLLRYAWTEKIDRLLPALGWTWNGWRSIGVGVGAFALYLLLSSLLSRALGPGIPYSKAGEGGAIAGWLGLLALLGYVLFALLTAAGEETMFRGLIQTQVGRRYGAWAGLGLAALLFGLRHLPADIFYAQVWDATPAMWLARQADLYLGAVLLGLARHVGGSTAAPAIMHVLIFMSILAQGFR